MGIRVAPILLLLTFVGCAENTRTAPRPDAETDGGVTDSSFDVMDTALADTVDTGGADVDAGAPLPERCSDENMFFEDEFGRMAYCIYVAQGGDDDEGEGTPTAPFRTIEHATSVAVARGVATGRVHAVAVSRGLYQERVQVQNGVSIYGNYDADDGWSRAVGNETIIENGEVADSRIEAVVAEGISAPTVLEGFTIRGGTAGAETGVDVYGVRVADSSPVVEELGGLILRDLVVRSGAGSPGANGEVGAAGENGAVGGIGDAGDKEDGDQTPGGVGTVTRCEGATIERTRGGTGGLGGGDNAMGCGTYTENATVGSPPPALETCAGGRAGDACSCVSPIDREGEPGGTGNVCVSGPAAVGTAATTPTVRGAVVDGVFQGQAGDDGVTGAHGVGGSGGGGGGSGCDAGGWGRTGGGGGAGGSGGCGGVGGGGGQAGGSSFALFVSGSAITVSDCSFESGRAANGGSGAAGGPGGRGGEGGAGGPGGYIGGQGGTGQEGGAGGAGAGGPGGSSVAAFLCESTVVGVELDALIAGAAGIAGAGDGAPGIAGFSGVFYEGCSL